MTASISHRLLLAILLPALLAGCLSDSDDNDPNVLIGDEYAAVATAAADFSSGAHSVINADAPYVAANNLNASGSDLAIAANGRHFYRIERFMADTIRKYDIANPGTPIWQFSAKSAAEPSSNPYDLVFVNNSKAYLIRYGSAKAWVVNPSVTNEAAFKTGELDLSAYADADGVPEMSAAAIANDKLFIAMQRFENFTTLQDAYVAVFDTGTNQEIDTRPAGSAETRKGIKLTIRNPSRIEHLPGSGKLYVLGDGKLACGFCNPATPAEFTGGIANIDASSYATAVVVDDSATTKNMVEMTLVSATLGYFVSYADFGDNTLFRFNPTTGVVGNAVSGFASKDIGTLALDRNELLWVGISDPATPGMRILDPQNSDSLVTTVNTGLNPIGIAFGAKPVQ